MLKGDRNILLFFTGVFAFIDGSKWVLGALIYLKMYPMGVFSEKIKASALEIFQSFQRRISQ